MWIAADGKSKPFTRTKTKDYGACCRRADEQRGGGFLARAARVRPLVVFAPTAIQPLHTHTRTQTNTCTRQPKITGTTGGWQGGGVGRRRKTRASHMAMGKTITRSLHLVVTKNEHNSSSLEFRYGIEIGPQSFCIFLQFYLLNLRLVY